MISFNIDPEQISSWNVERLWLLFAALCSSSIYFTLLFLLDN